MTNAQDIVSDALVEALSPGARASRVSRLTGGVSAETFALTLTQADGTEERLVVRHRPPASAKGALSTAQEYAVLSALHASGLPVPRPRLQWSAETLVMAWVEGTSKLPDHGPIVMAEALARIHSQRGAALVELPGREDPTPVLARVLTRIDVEDLERTLHTAASDAQCLLHGDFWPGNLLWRGDELVAILDWEDAAVGDPLSDVACTRVELEVAAGPEAATAFTTHYLPETRRDSTRLSLWDIYVSTTALESMDSWGLPTEVLEHRRAITRAFRNRAVEALKQAPRSNRP